MNTTLHRPCDLTIVEEDDIQLPPCDECRVGED